MAGPLATPVLDYAPPTSRPIPPVAWVMLWLLFMASALSFLDRQVLSVLSPQLMKELAMTNTEYSRVVSAFVLSYTIMFSAGGWLIDRIGTRLGLGLSVLLWSLASAAHALCRGALGLGAARLVLGLGEGSCFPAATKGACEWFPAHKRAMAIGIATGGSAFGAVLAPPLTAWLAGVYGWRGAFVATGLIGIVWVGAWLVASLRHRQTSSGHAKDSQDEAFAARPAEVSPGTEAAAASAEYCRRCGRDLASVPPADHRRAVCNPAIPRHKHENSAPISAAVTLDYAPPPAPSRMQLLARPATWRILAARFCFDPVFYFYMFWIPQYLSKERGFSLQRIGSLYWIPFLALGISNLAAGPVSDALVRRGWSPRRARATLLLMAAAITPVSCLVVFAPSAGWAIALMSCLLIAHGVWICNYLAHISDQFPSKVVATVVGLSGTVGGSAGMIANLIIGPVVDRFSFVPIFIATSTLYPAAFLILFVGGRSDKEPRP